MYGGILHCLNHPIPYPTDLYHELYTTSRAGYLPFLASQAFAPNRSLCLFIFFFKILFIQREREAESQAEGEAGPMQGARCGTRSWVSRITPRAAGGAKPLRHWGCPHFVFFNLIFFVSIFFFLLALWIYPVTLFWLAGFLLKISWWPNGVSLVCNYLLFSCCFLRTSLHLSFLIF